MGWIRLRPYDVPGTEVQISAWEWVNADRIDRISVGSLINAVIPPTTVHVGISTVRVEETPEEIFFKMSAAEVLPCPEYDIRAEGLPNSEWSGGDVIG